MTGNDRFERDLPAVLEGLYLGPLPSYRNDILSQTAATRQRPGWTFTERWLPMSALTERMAAAPRVPLRMVAVVALLILALVAAALYVGSQQRRLPEPFGPAGNGLVAYADSAGDIFVGDPVAGTTKRIVAGQAAQQPIFSPDGTKVAFLRDNYQLDDSARGVDVVVVNADGSHEHVISTENSYISYFGWSADSTSVVVGFAPTGTLTVLDATGRAAPRLVAKGLSGPGSSTASGGEYYRKFAWDLRPASDQIVTIGYDGGHTLSVLDVATGASRVLVDPSRTDIEYTNLHTPVWSPDGSMIAFTATSDSFGGGRVYVMNTEGTGLRQLRQQTLASMGCTSPCQVVSEWNPAWSPDGTKIAIMRFFDRSSGETLSTRPITVVDVGSGLSHEIGEPMYGSYGWGWSPDGKSILALPGLGGDQNSPGRFHIIDVATGTVRYVDWDAGFSAPSWQRVAFD